MSIKCSVYRLKLFHWAPIVLMPIFFKFRIGLGGPPEVSKRVIPCEINKFWKSFPPTNSDFLELWYTPSQVYLEKSWKDLDLNSKYSWRY